MKPVWLIWLAGSISLAGLASGADGQTLFDPGQAHLRWQIQDAGFVRTSIHQTPAGIELVNFLNRCGRQLTGPSFKKLTSTDLRVFDGAAVDLAMDLRQPGGPPPRGMLVIRPAKGGQLKKMVKWFLPESKKNREMIAGKFRLAAAAALPAEKGVPAGLTAAAGPRLLILAWGIDLAQWLQHEQANTFFPPVRPAEPAGQSVMSFHLSWQPLLAELEGRWLNPPPPEGLALASLPALLPPAERTALFGKLGLEALRSLDMQVSSRGDAVLYQARVELGNQPGILREYLGHLRGGSLQAAPLLQGRSWFCQDLLAGLPRLYQLLVQALRETAGGTGAQLVTLLEGIVQSRTGASLAGELLPAAGPEYGMVEFPPVPPDVPAQTVFFLAPPAGSGAAALAAMLSRRENREPRQETFDGKTVYSFDNLAGQPVYAMEAGSLLLLARSIAALQRFLNETAQPAATGTAGPAAPGCVLLFNLPDAERLFSAGLAEWWTGPSKSAPALPPGSAPGPVTGRAVLSEETLTLTGQLPPAHCRRVLSAIIHRFCLPARVPRPDGKPQGEK